MAAIDFPASPVNGQLFAAGNGVTYQYNSVATAWLVTTASSTPTWRQIARTVPTTVTNIDFTALPADINDLMFTYDVFPVTNAVGLVLQFFDNVGTIITTGYAFSTTVATHSQTALSAPSVQGSATVGYSSGIILSWEQTTRRVGNVSGIRGRGMVYGIRNTGSFTSCDYQNIYISDDAATQCIATGSGVRSAAGLISGLRFFWTSGTFFAGGSINLWGSP